MPEDNEIVMERGWWKLTYTGVNRLSECTEEHIGQKIAEGYTEGEIFQEETK